MSYIITFFTTIFILFFVLLIFNVMILVHELGHYWAALWRKLVVEKFQIWFGKPIYKKKINGVQWGVGSIPAGGFVALPQMAPMEKIEGDGEVEKAKLPKAKPIDKIITAFAGPLFSLLLACLFSLFVWYFGKPISKSYLTTTIGYIHPDMPGAKSGLKIGDKILSINGKEVDRWAGIGGDVSSNIILSRGDKIAFEVDRNGEKKVINVGFHVEETSAFVRPKQRQVGIVPAYEPMIGAFIGKEFEGGISPAKLGGLKKYDVILELNGNFSYNKVSHAIFFISP